MVRRGSTVRVRQRALRKRRTSALLVQVDLLNVERAVGMEPFMETHHYGSKHYSHPLVGNITVFHEATQLIEGDHYLFLYSVEPGSPSEDAMRLLEALVARQAEQGRKS